MYHSWHKIIITILKTSSSILSLMEQVKISQDLLPLFTFIMVVSAFILPLAFLCLFLFRFLGFKSFKRDSGFLFLMSLFDAWPWTLCAPRSLRMQMHYLDVKRKIKIHIKPPTTTKERSPICGIWICGTAR